MSHNEKQQRQPGAALRDKEGGYLEKTVNELKELHTRNRKQVIKTKYVKKESSNPYPPKKVKSEEEIKEEERLKKKEIKAASSQISCSSPYYDDTYEYRHVVLPLNLLKYMPSGLLQTQQWLDLGVRQSPSWEHYMIYAPEPHILLFRRDKEYRQKRQEMKEAAQKENKKAEEDNTIATTISDIPPSSRTGLFRTRSLR